MRSSGGRVVSRQPALGMLVAEGPAVLAPALRAVPGTVVSPDATVRTRSLGFTAATQNGSMTTVTALTGATAMWKAGWTGKGVDVAVIDTGVAPVPALSAPDKVVVGPDLSFESQDPDTRYLDSYGHGTHMSSIIAGREVAAGSGAAYAADPNNFYGMAPDARIVSIKAGDHQGAVDVSQVVAAINWVAQFGRTNGLNVRVLNLSLGLDSPQDPTLDPLGFAAQVAWDKGIVVVASVGNSGDVYPGINEPAANPRIIGVGAVDTKGTATSADDTIPSFSATQGGNYGTRTPDLVAPGVGIVAAQVPGSTLSEAYPSARVATSWIRGSGTSQAAAVVSGAAALLLQQRPWLTPDQLKAQLVTSATRLGGIPTGSQGAGELNLVRATATTTPTTVQSVRSPIGGGSLESSRGGQWLRMDGADLNGENTAFGTSWNNPAVVQPATTAANSMWSADGTTWNGSQILGPGFAADTTTWAGKTWQGKTWQGRTWAGWTWSGRTWAGKTWQGGTWTGSSWDGADWDDVVGDSKWATSTWSTGAWN